MKSDVIHVTNNGVGVKEARVQAELILIKPHLRLSPFVGVIDTLSGQSRQLRDFRDGQVIVVIIFQNALLFVGQKLSVKIEQKLFLNGFSHVKAPV